MAYDVRALMPSLLYDKNPCACQVRAIWRCVSGQERDLLWADWLNWWVCLWVPAFEIQIFLTPWNLGAHEQMWGDTDILYVTRMRTTEQQHKQIKRSLWGRKSVYLNNTYMAECTLMSFDMLLVFRGIPTALLKWRIPRWPRSGLWCMV